MIKFSPESALLDFLIMLRRDTFALKDLHKLETQEISQKALSDAPSSQWVDNLIANMPINGTRGHIRELTNHLLRCCVNVTYSFHSTNYISIRFRLTLFYGIYGI